MTTDTRRALYADAAARAQAIAARLEEHFHLDGPAERSEAHLAAIAIGLLSRFLQLDPAAGRHAPAEQAQLADEAAAIALVLSRRTHEEAQSALARSFQGRLAQAAQRRPKPSLTGEQ